MFLRKLTVLGVPLVLCAGVCLLLKWLGGLGFFAWVAGGLVLGLALALLLPLSGASRRREPFGGLLWIPALILLLVIAYQYLYSVGMVSGILNFLATDQLILVLTEAAFAGFMITTCLRTRA